MVEEFFADCRRYSLELEKSEFNNLLMALKFYCDECPLLESDDKAHEMFRRLRKLQRMVEWKH